MEPCWDARVKKDEAYKPKRFQNGIATIRLLGFISILGSRSPDDPITAITRFFVPPSPSTSNYDFKSLTRLNPGVDPFGFRSPDALITAITRFLPPPPPGIPPHFTPLTPQATPCSPRLVDRVTPPHSIFRRHPTLPTLS